MPEHVGAPFLVMIILLMWPSPDRACLGLKREVVRAAACAGGAALLTAAVLSPVYAGSIDGSQVAWFIAAAASGAALARALVEHALRSGPLAERLRTNIAIYGAGPEARELFDTIAREPGARFAGLFEDRSAGRVDAHGLEIAGSTTELAELVARGLVDEVIIALPRSAADRMQAIADRLRELPVDVHISSADAVEIAASGKQSPSPVGSAVLKQIHRRAIRDWDVLLKSGLDRLMALSALIALAPLFAIVGAAIRLESKGPVFFRQKRHGVCGETIVVWKFRTMRVMEDGAVVRQASKDDQRVTRVGRFLRRTSLDELPQLINVLIGEMSIVGPRPHAIAHNEHYGAIIRNYGRRAQVRPGITGWAQVNGFRGETRSPDEMAARVEHDLWYIANWSLWLDMKIIILTPIYGFVHKNAY
ncbi:MAG TPA: undecaprenyl-phosphate glucose phosphotransferase [Hyphomicrobiaceae bacterium]|nr:undecaprenyl-phosphate glucose phosphotransferase [Hyphomicrobiaceae bacterium]